MCCGASQVPRGLRGASILLHIKNTHAQRNTQHNATQHAHTRTRQDTYALAFAAAGKAELFSQVQVPPGAALAWRENMLRVKATRA